jgi:hypothetical protein
VFALPNVLDLLVYELAGGRRRALALAQGGFRFFDCTFFRHEVSFLDSASTSAQLLGRDPPMRARATACTTRAKSKHLRAVPALRSLPTVRISR